LSQVTETRSFRPQIPADDAVGLQVTEITRILKQIEQGNSASAAELLPLVYAALRRMAGYRLQREKPGQTLQATALVHEAYIQLVGNAEIRWEGRSRFFAAAAEAMRRILVDHARRRKSVKHGGNFERQDLMSDVAAESGDVDQLLDLDAALTRLGTEDPDMAKLVELRYFAGLSVEETARALGLSPRTVKRNWAYARAWLGRELNEGESQ
jgi:RNA polymerase sigma factor (TIGR02999 family)